MSIAARTLVFKGFSFTLVNSDRPNPMPAAPDWFAAKLSKKEGRSLNERISISGCTPQKDALNQTEQVFQRYVEGGRLAATEDVFFNAIGEAR